MFGRFLPRETSFFDFFEQHARLTLEGTKEFLDLVTFGDNLAARAKRIKEIEHESDDITHRCVEALHKTFITPIDRWDIHRLISRMDDVMDLVEAVAERMVLYEIREMTPEVKELAKVLVKAVTSKGEALRGLRNLKNSAEVVKKCIEINRLENEGDTIFRIATARLFKEEKDPIMVIKWKEIYESLEAATDRCEDVANIIEGVIMEHV
jgi:predicted phosphate transport protein (TIGR00153 family)